MQRLSRTAHALTSVLLFGLASIAEAHGHDEMNTAAEITDATPGQEVAESQTYFHHGAYAGFMTAHIILMTIGWAFMLPVGKELELP